MKANYYIFVLLLLVCSGCYKNPPERNKIVFEGNFDSIQSAIGQLDSLASDLPPSRTNSNVYYEIKQDSLFVNEIFVHEKAPSRVIDQLFGGETERAVQFISLAKYLNENHIESGFLDQFSALWHFQYRELEEANFNDVRSVVFVRDAADEQQVMTYFKILDKRGSLLLIVPKGAEIR